MTRCGCLSACAWQQFWSLRDLNFGITVTSGGVYNLKQPFKTRARNTRTLDKFQCHYWIMLWFTSAAANAHVIAVKIIIQCKVSISWQGLGFLMCLSGATLLVVYTTLGVVDLTFFSCGWLYSYLRKLSNRIEDFIKIVIEVVHLHLSHSPCDCENNTSHVNLWNLPVNSVHAHTQAFSMKQNIKPTIGPTS